MSCLVVLEKISNKNDLKYEISRHIWCQDGKFDIDTILQEVKKTEITMPNCTDEVISDTIQYIIGLFTATGHIISNSGKFLYV